MEDVTTQPPWLNEDFFLYALSGTSSKSDFEIHSFQRAQSTLSDGDNFCSEVHKYKIKYKVKGENEIKLKTFFIKTPIETGPLLDIVREENMFEKELNIYNEYFPLVERLVGSMDMIPTRFPSKKKSAIILEDLSEKGYVMRDKKEQLDFDHSAEVLRSLAAFHAASVVAHENNPTLVETIGEPTLYKNESSKFSILFKEKLETFNRIVQNWKGFERFGELCRKYSEKAFDDVKNIYSRRKTLNVMNHGDAWTNNVMFKYDVDGKVEKAVLIDFQLSLFGSIGIDLQYFIFTSIQPAVREQRLPELHSLYLNTLNSCLEKFGSEERMSREQFEDELDFTLFYVYFSFAIAHYLMIAGKYKETDVVDKDGNVLTAYDDKWYRTNAEHALLYLEGAGFFNKI